MSSVTSCTRKKCFFKETREAKKSCVYLGHVTDISLLEKKNAMHVQSNRC